MSAVSFEEKLRQLDIVFVIDATGSMGSCIKQVQERLNYLAKAIAEAPAQPDVAFGAVAYRDHPPEDRTFVTQVYPVTRSLAQAQKTINRISAAGGGDTEEAVKDGLWDALKKGGWRPAAYKVIILAGDAPARERCQCGITFEQIIDEARSAETPIFAVGTSAHKTMIAQFTRLAQETGGRFVRLADAGQLIDAVLSQLQETVIVDMEIGLAVYKGRMRGLPVANIAGRVDRSVEEVQAILASLERKGADWSVQTKVSAPAHKKPKIKAPPPGQQPGRSPRPVIVPIVNPIGHPSYEVLWVGWTGAQWYELQESHDASFANATTVWEGPDTCWVAAGRAPGTYCYRVRMIDAQGTLSAWSEGESTTVRKKGERP